MIDDKDLNKNCYNSPWSPLTCRFSQKPLIDKRAGEKISVCVCYGQPSTTKFILSSCPMDSAAKQN